MSAAKHESKPVSSSKRVRAGDVFTVGEADSIWVYQVVQVVDVRRRDIVVREIYCERREAYLPIRGDFVEEQMLVFEKMRGQYARGTQRLYPCVALK